MILNLIQQAFDWLDEGTALQEARSPSQKPESKLRQITLCNQTVAYQFTRSKRRTIGFIVGTHGLAVRAPRWTTVHEVEAAIQEKSGWILKKLYEFEQRQVHSHRPQMLWADGANIDYLGEPFIMHLGALYTTIDPDQKRIWIALPSTASETQIQESVQSAIQRAARLLFEVRLNHYAPLLGVQWSSLKLSNAGGRWGSATSNGVIRLNWRLMHYRLPVIDYVVVHELSHLRHMNHSPQFWETVESIMPNYSELKKELKPS